MKKNPEFDSEERRIIFFSSASHFFTHFYMLAFPALVMPVSRDLGLPVSSVLRISFWMYLLYGILALGWGWISDCWGHRWALGSGMLVAGAGLVGASLVRNPALMSLCFACVGVGCASYHPSGVALVTQGIRLRGRALGISGIWGNAGMAAVPLVIGLLNYLMGWQAGVSILGSAGILLGILVFLTPFSVVRGQDRKTLKELDRRAALRLFIIFCVGLIFGGLMFRGFTLLLPAFLEHRLGDLTYLFRRVLMSRFSSAENTAAFDTFTANLSATFVYLLGIVGQFLGGRVADRYSLKHSYLVFFLLALPFSVAMVLLRSFFLIPAAGFFALFALGMQPIENSLIAYLTPARWRSISYGIKYTLIFGAGSFAVWILGATEKAYGIEGAMAITSFLVLLVIINTLVFLGMSRKHELRH